jgi:Type II secretion system (T2SS), protein M subtype b
MSQEHPITGNTVAPRRQISIPFGQMAGQPVFNVIGLPELIGLAGAAFLAITVVFAYLYFYLPANVHLKSAELELRRLQGERQKSSSALEEGKTTKESVDSIHASIEHFETSWLPMPSSGRMSLYTVLNNLIKSNGLRNTAGPSYSQLEVAGTKTGVQPTVTAEKQNNAKWQSIYPGIAVTVTVEGAYPNIRHFVRDIESSRQFLIINAIELEGVRSEAGQDHPAAPVSPSRSSKNLRNVGAEVSGPAEIAGPRSGMVSLRLDLATYFQRPDAKEPSVN